LNNRLVVLSIKEMFMKTYLLALVLTTSLSGFALGQEPSKVTDAKEFVPMAAMSDLFEIETGKLAENKSQNKDIRAAGKQLVSDHTKSSQELEALSKQAGVTFEKPVKLDEKHQQKLEKLAAADGKAFDEAFKVAQIQAHEEGVALFKSYSESGDQPYLKQFAAKTLPVLEHHMEMIEQAKP
jgi:putative membrane protein